MQLYSVTFPTKNKFEGLSSFVYGSEYRHQLGDLVLCPFGKKEVVGIINAVDVPKPKFAFKNIIRVVASGFLPASSIELSNWISTYYASGNGVTLELFCTKSLISRISENGDKKWLRLELDKLDKEGSKLVSLNKLNKLHKSQKEALGTIQNNKQLPFILHGATGSGKTEIYLHAAHSTLSKNKSVIILVPEIGLTSQNIERFNELGVPLITLHSKQTPVQRARSWQLISELTKQNSPIIVVGPRSAMFTPIFNLGLIVIDEFHDQSYKQDSNPKYHSLLAAGMLSSLTKSKLILGSATPNVSDLYTLLQKKVPLLELPVRDSQKKSVTILDSRDNDNFKQSKIISIEMQEAISQNLSLMKQSLIFHNRRGSSLLQICSNCEWINSCPNCFIPLTFHADHYSVNCHTCGFKDKPKMLCPLCQAEALSLRGFGTKQVVSELERLFPDARIARFDADNTTKESTLAHNFQNLKEGKVDIIVGTQMLAKGLDLPHLGLVGLVQAEAGLTMPDFRSSERTFQLITQVIGRVGRGHSDGKVIIQSYTPEHPSVKLGAKEDYQTFYEKELAERKQSLSPPFRYQLKLTGRYSTEYAAKKAATTLVNEIKAKLQAPLPQIIGPSPAFRERVAGKFQYQIVIKSSNRNQLLKIIEDHLPINWNFDIDPMTLL